VFFFLTSVLFLSSKADRTFLIVGLLQKKEDYFLVFSVVALYFRILSKSFIEKNLDENIAVDLSSSICVFSSQ